MDIDTIESGKYLWTPNECDYFKMALRPITHVTSDSFDGQFESDYIIPEGVKSIRKSDFCEIPDWTTFKFPSSLEEFEGIDANSCNEICIEFKSPSSLRVIPDDAFCGCKHLNHGDAFIIPNGVVKIGDYAFSGCSALISIIIPNSVTNIGDRAFEDCSSLTSITIPNGVTSIGDRAFEGCSALTSITIPNSVTSIGDRAFEDCSSLTSITIPNGVISIGDRAFEGCQCTIRAPKALALVGKIPEACTLIEY
ncbi:MAG: leucine-rich repeat domain-containing protein [Paludibacteraceae bacterium]